MTDLGTMSMVQADGSVPSALAAGSAWPDSGIAIHRWRFRGGAHVNTKAKQHQIWFASPARFDCRIGGDETSHDMPPGSLAIAPAGVDCFADVRGSFESLLITVDPTRFALAAVEDAAYDARLMTRVLSHDETLVSLARHLAAENASGYPNGTLRWNELAARFLEALLLRHTAEAPPPARGEIGKDTLKLLKDFVVEHLDEPITVATLSALIGRSPFHFSRIFSRSVGVTPHRFIVHLRLKRAVALAREKQSSLAEIAVRTGFADQSHLSRWVKRVYGISLTQLAA